MGIEMPVKIDSEKCSKCGVCYSVCPFDTISHGNGDCIVIDMNKCQLCGICYAGCPSSAISLEYYTYENLIDELKSELEPGTENLVLMCRGASQTSCDFVDKLKGGKKAKFVHLRLPCVGRVGIEFYLEAIELGIKKIISIQCGDEFCRYKDGSHLNRVKTAELNKLLEEVGYGDLIEVIESKYQVDYSPDKCVGCDKCVFICPYDAIEAKSLGTPKVNIEKCRGCGLCTVVCPHLGLQIGDYNFENVYSSIIDYGAEAIRLKENGFNEPVVLVFCCQWAEFSRIDNIRNGFIRKNVAMIEIPCFSALNPSHILQAFNFGFDGVLGVVCSDEDCKNKETRESAEYVLRVFKSGLKLMNLEKRFDILKNHPRLIHGFDEKLDLFLKEVSLYGKKECEK